MKNDREKSFSGIGSGCFKKISETYLWIKKALLFSRVDGGRAPTKLRFPLTISTSIIKMKKNASENKKTPYFSVG